MELWVLLQLIFSSPLLTHVILRMFFFSFFFFFLPKSVVGAVRGLTIKLGEVREWDVIVRRFPEIAHSFVSKLLSSRTADAEYVLN